MTKINEKIDIADDEIKAISVADFRSEGYLQEANRRFFHPLGLALSVKIENGEETFAEIWDYRDDPEGMLFHNSVFEKPKFRENIKKIDLEWKAKSIVRKKTWKCKFGIQTTQYQFKEV